MTTDKWGKILDALFCLVILFCAIGLLLAFFKISILALSFFGFSLFGCLLGLIISLTVFGLNPNRNYSK